jgi:hypothetical protein
LLSSLLSTAGGPFRDCRPAKLRLKGWSGLNQVEWDGADLSATITDYQPPDDYCCCLAVQPEIVAIDLDIVDEEHAAITANLADNILGITPLVRIGLAPKQIRVYRTGDFVKSRKLHPLEIFSGSGQFIAYGWHAKAGRPYIWPQDSPLSISSYSHDIPSVTRAKIEHFTTVLFKVVPRRLLPTRQDRPSGAGAPQTVGERLRMLTTLHGSWRRAASIVLSEAGEGYYNETLWAVVSSAAGRGIPEDVVWELVEQHFHRDPKVPETKVASDLGSMIERTRHKPRQRSAMTFSPVSAGSGNDR